MFDDVSSHPVYGFNNPGPSPDRSDYGYEFWIKVSDGVESSGDVQVRDFEGGLYAVTTCALAGDPNGTVPEVWLQLLHWVQESKHEWRRTTHELEKLVNPGAEEKDIILELYLPIEPGGPT
jgi:DNA gyrase inhibitor GyrI